MFRLSLIVGIFGILVIIGGAIIFSLEQASQRAPLEIAPPPNAELYIQEDLSGAARRLYYLVPDTTPEDISTYYNQIMVDFYGNDSGAERCRRLPITGNYDGYVEGNGMLPYNFRCLFDSSSFQSDRYTQVDIQPGVLHPDGNDNRGSVIIEYLQQWQR